MDQHLRQGADCQDFDINSFVAAIEVNSKQVFPVELEEVGADYVRDISLIIFCIVIQLLILQAGR
jgi:hypothetical protein